MRNLCIIITFIFIVGCTHSQNRTKNTLQFADTVRVLNDLVKITNTQKPRNYKNIITLDSVADYIKSELIKICDTTAFQNYKVENKTYKNVIGSIGTENKERIIIGAHYDVYGNHTGADDNASGVAGILELARLLSKEKLNYRIDFVAYTLEEPPFFRTEQMGSAIHANYLYKNKISVKGMICLEMIGYYNSKPNSQEYPIPGMSLIYGNKADYITVVQHKNSGEFSDEFNQLFKSKKIIKTESLKGNSMLPGVDFSDHLNYWNLNYDAVMITNTAFYRNKNYHKKGDILSTLNLHKMSLVIEQLFLTIKTLK
ncbi:M28 family peptidase [Aureibaculum algae]|uniref:M28 family peptidase n=1 Tax=Aureibaculum algae TaxID=2584122 RepID=A0A5B7TME2_9FLAO|nr:M28 family peptidase [Aureibaculum algae]QCX37969.1 M28 family peptidase [Aureibaculum algae]